MLSSFAEDHFQYLSGILFAQPVRVGHDALLPAEIPAHPAVVVQVAHSPADIRVLGVPGREILLHIFSGKLPRLALHLPAPAHGSVDHNSLRAGMYQDHAAVGAFSDDDVDMSAAIQKVKNGYSIIAGSPEMSKADKMFDDPSSAYLLKDLIDALAEDFDYFLIDTAPARNIPLNMCYIAADYFIICLDFSEDSLDGIDAMVNDLMKFHKSGKRSLSDAKILGAVIIRYRDINIGNAIKDLTLEKIETIIPDIIKTKETPFLLTVRLAAAVDEAKISHLPLQVYKHSSTAAIDYRYIADEIIRRVEK